MTVSRSNELSGLAGIQGGFAPLDSGLLVPITYLPTGTGATQVAVGNHVHEFAEAASAVLVNATSAGDAGGRADHFTGTSLNAAWISEAAAVTAGPTVKYSCVGIAATTAHHRLRAYTPSGAFRVETRVRQRLNGGCSFLIRDSGTGDASGNGMSIFYDSSNFWTMYSLDAGTYNSRGSVSVANGIVGDWVYLAIERNGSNQWDCQVSLDRALWISCAALYSKTFTVAKAGYRVSADTISIDFFDVVS